MKILRFVNIILLFAVLFSCTKENPIITPCDHSLPGLICKEYRYDKGAYIGYIQYGYNVKKQLVQQDLYSVNHTSVRKNYEYSSTGQLKAKTSITAGGEIIESYDYQYNEFDSLSTITFIKDKKLQCLTTCEYNPQFFLNTKKSEFSDGTTTHYTYLYDGNNLYKESVYNMSDQLLSYSVYTYFSNHFKRLSHFGSTSSLLSYEIIQYNTKGELLEIKYYNSENELLKKELWSYENGLLIKYAFYNADETLVSCRLYQY